MTEDPRVRRLEIAISYALRAGVVCSFVLVIAGLALTLAQHPGWSDESVQSALGPRGSPYSTWAGVFAGLARRDGEALTMLGLLVLIGTPVMRVAVSIALFAVQKDRVFTAITALVLALLIVSFAVGEAGG